MEDDIRNSSEVAAFASVPLVKVVEAPEAADLCPLVVEYSVVAVGVVATVAAE